MLSLILPFVRGIHQSMGITLAEHEVCQTLISLLLSWVGYWISSLMSIQLKWDSLLLMWHHHNSLWNTCKQTYTPSALTIQIASQHCNSYNIITLSSVLKIITKTFQISPRSCQVQYEDWACSDGTCVSNVTSVPHKLHGIDGWSNFNFLACCNKTKYVLISPQAPYSRMKYLQFSNIRRTQSQNIDVFRLVLLLSLPNPLKPGVKLRMKM